MEGFSLFWIPFCIVMAEGGITMGIVRWMIPLAASAAAAVLLGSVFGLVLPSGVFETGLIPVDPAYQFGCFMSLEDLPLVQSNSFVSRNVK